MEELLKQILTEIQSVKKEIIGVKEDVSQLQVSQTRLEQKVDGIYQSVVRLEEGQPLDIFAILGNIDHKLDTKDSEIAVLNKRVFKVESDLERINRQ